MNKQKTPNYPESLANELLSKFRRLDSVISHAPSKGTYHEKIIRAHLKSMISPAFSVGEGFIINSEAEVSTQLDVLVVDNLDPRSYGFREDDFFIASDFAVCSYGEIKTKPSKAQFISAFAKLVNASRLLEIPARTTSFLFCFDVPVDQAQFGKWGEDAIAALGNRESLQPWNFPDYIFCLEKGVMRAKQEVYPSKVQYVNITPAVKGSNAVQVKIIQDLYSCIVDGCGRMRLQQNINLHP